MLTGFDTAISELTLVLFTTLAPSGVVAYMLMAGVLVCVRLTDEVRRRIDKWLCIPIVASMVGLVASATHLGNPANALYVFLGVGRSPLSTEVFCAVLFLLFAGVYWLYSFRVRPNRLLQRVWLVVSLPVACAFVMAIAFAYAADTIVGWDTWYTPLSMWTCALATGPLLALAALRVAQWEPVRGRFGGGCAWLSAGAFAASVAVFVAQGAALPQLQNAIVSAAQLVPFYGPMLVAFCLLGAAGWAFTARVRREGFSARPLVWACTGWALMLAGVFIMRFAFYMMHLTVGVGV